jgi:hypothetical protein
LLKFCFSCVFYFQFSVTPRREQFLIFKRVAFPIRRKSRVFPKNDFLNFLENLVVLVVRFIFDRLCRKHRTIRAGVQTVSGFAFGDFKLSAGTFAGTNVCGLFQARVFKELSINPVNRFGYFFSSSFEPNL